MTTLQQQYEKAKKVISGGVNSSTRLNQAIGTPFFASKAIAGHVWDIEGRKFIDMSCAHGAALLGHSHPAIDNAMQTAAKLGYVNSFETQYHEELASKICQAIPCAERVRFCSAGSEATLHMIRGCRAFTGRQKIIRFEGHFHGYHELIFIGGHPPASHLKDNRNHPYIESAGIPQLFADFIIPIPFNDPEALKQAIDKHGHETAAVILEPINYNSGCIKAQPDFLKLLRDLTKEAGIILFFDEIQSSFKKSPGGAQQDFGITPDVCTIGKALGGGLPLSAFCGKAEIMEIFQPIGPAAHSGTFNAHIIPILAGLAFINEIKKPEFYSTLQKLEAQFHQGIDRIIKDNNLNMIVPYHGARFDIVLGRKTPALRYEDTLCHNKDLMLKIIKACFDRGVYFHDYGGSCVHHGYSIQHTTEDIDKVLNVLEDVLLSIKNLLKN